MIYEGELFGFVDAETADVHEIGLMMTRHPLPANRRGRMRLRLPFTIERRLEVPRWLPLAVTIGAVFVSFVISGFIILLVGGDPIKSFQHMFDAAFGSPGVISDTLVKATPLILTGLACALVFRMRLWNIGAEGQFLMGAWGASAVVFLPLVPAGITAFITIPLMMLTGFLAGAAWGFIPGVLKARFAVNEIIVTLMLNYIALLWITYWVFGPWSSGGFQITEQLPRRGVAAATDRSRQAIPGFRRPDRPPRACVWPRRGSDRVVRSQAHALGLRDPADRR